MGSYNYGTSASFDLLSNSLCVRKIEIMIADFDSEFEYEINFGDSAPMNVYPPLYLIFDSVGTYTILSSVTDTGISQ